MAWENTLAIMHISTNINAKRNNENSFDVDLKTHFKAEKTVLFIQTIILTPILLAVLATVFVAATDSM